MDCFKQIKHRSRLKNNKTINQSSLLYYNYFLVFALLTQPLRQWDHKNDDKNEL